MRTVAFDKDQVNVSPNSRERKKTFLKHSHSISLWLFSCRKKSHAHIEKLINLSNVHSGDREWYKTIGNWLLKPYHFHIQQLVIWMKSDDKYFSLIVVVVCFVCFWISLPLGCFIFHCWLFPLAFASAHFFALSFASLPCIHWEWDISVKRRFGRKKNI